jgi:hypothetical protein
MTIAVQAAPRRSGALMSLGRIDAAIALFAVFGGLMASGLAAYHDRPWSLISLVAVPAALWPITGSRSSDGRSRRGRD